MSTIENTSVLLTVRGKYIPPTIEGARTLHNDTAGSQAGIAAARSLGDLSHKVFAPVTAGLSSAKAGELLFIDVWDNPKGIMDFFSNPHVQQQGANLFAAREPTVWMPARGAFTYSLAAPAGRNDRYVGLIRGRIGSPEKAIEAFRALKMKTQREARRLGVLSHELFIKMNAPGDTSPVELLGVDVWFDSRGMAEHYGSESSMAGLKDVFTAQPDASIWEQAPGAWSEW